jgi:ATP-dependent protease HslVU (ClpYQ) peptidase subunit
MTTIAINKEDGKIIVSADTLMTGIWKDSKKFIKIYKLIIGRDQEVIVGGSGSAASVYAFFDWCTKGMNYDDYPVEHAEEAQFILVNKKSVCCYESYPRPIETGFPYSIGSGSQYAMGAMLAGSSTVDAVKIAAKLDPYTNNKVHTLLLE